MHRSCLKLMPSIQTFLLRIVVIIALDKSCAALPACLLHCRSWRIR